MKVLTVDEMISAEKAAAALGISYAEMMAQAGQGVADAIMQRKDVKGRSVLVLVGTGNNGADGLIAGLHLAAAGADVAFYLFKPRDAESDPVFAQVQAAGLLVLVAEHDMRYRVLRTRLNVTDILIDALLGWGVSRPIDGDLAALFKQVKAGIAPLASTPTLQSLTQPSADTHTPVFVVAVDTPSGIDLDTGSADPHTLAADLTVTFAAAKQGHFKFPAADYCGELVVADIGMPPKILKHIETEVATPAKMRDLLPARPRDGHKGTFGRVLIAGGSQQYQGAPALAARAAFRAGSGLVELLVPSEAHALTITQLPEAIVNSYEDNTMGMYTVVESRFVAGYKNANACLIGPGMGTANLAMKACYKQKMLTNTVLDADALNWLAQQDKWWTLLHHTTILTPHPGEMARLTGEKIAGVDRIRLVRHYAYHWKVTVVLKGAYTVIGTPTGQVTVIPVATPLLATAGSGDVLAGVIVSLLGQGLESADAAVLGAYLHAQAGQLLAQKYGDAGLLAHEIADVLPIVRQRCAAG